jgi:hypothetical protein
MHGMSEFFSRGKWYNEQVKLDSGSRTGTSPFLVGVSLHEGHVLESDVPVADHLYNSESPLMSNRFKYFLNSFSQRLLTTLYHYPMLARWYTRYHTFINCQ